MPRPDTVVFVSAAGGARLYAAIYHKNANTTPVLLLHSGLLSSDVWASEVKRLAGSRQVIVMDARGHGRSTLGAMPFSYALLEADAMTVLDSLHVPKVDVVGWSDGGIAGLLLAIDHPDRVAALLTYGANFDHSGDITTKPDSQIVALNRRYEALGAAEYRRLSPTPNDFRTFEAALGKLYVSEPAIAPAALHSIRVPTMIVAGDHDEFVLRSHSERLAALIPGAQLVILPDVSHEGPLQDPDGFHRVVQRFLSRALHGVGLQKGCGAGLQHRFEVGDHLGPAARHGLDELGGLALDGMGDGELDRRSVGLELHRAQRLALGFELGLVQMLPTDHEA